MPIVEAVLTPPATPAPKRVRLAGVTTVSSTRSPFTGTEQIMRWPAEWWEGQVGLPPMARAQAEEWVAFLLANEGGFRRFMFGDPAGKVPRGTASGAILVDGANQGGKIIALRGFAANLQNALMSGDYMSIDGHLYKVLAAEDADPAGKAAFSIFPRLRTAPADGTAVVLQNATGIWRLAETKAEWDIDEAIIYGVSFNMVEAF